MAQFGRPSADTINIGPFTGVGASSPNLWQAIDESTASDTDYVESPSNPVGTEQYGTLLSSVFDPNSSSGHVVRYRYAKSASSGRTINLVIRLFQGDSTEIASWSHSNISNTITTASQTLTSTQADAITDYSDLRIRFDPTSTGGGAGRTARLYWAEIEVPDAPLSLTQAAYRFRNDNGGDISATWKAAENTAISLGFEVFRLRIAIEQTGGTTGAKSFGLQYRLNGGTWTGIAIAQVVEPASSSFVTEITVTTDQIGGAGTFQQGQFRESANPLSVSLGSGQHTEIEWVLDIVNDVIPVGNGDTVELRAVVSGNPLDNYTNVPTITVSVPGTQFDQPLTASLSFTGSAAKQGRKSFSGSQSFSGAISKRPARALTGALSFTGAVAKQAGKAVSGALSFSGNLATQKFIERLLTATLSFTGSVAKRSSRSFTASQGFTGAIAKSTGRSLTGGLSFAGAVAKRAGKLLAGAVSFTGAVTSLKVLERSFTATLSFSGAVSKRTSRNLTGGLGFTGAIAKRTSRALAGALSFAGASAKRTSRALTGGLSFSGTVTSLKVFVRNFTASLSFSGAMTKRTGKNLAASQSFTGAMTKSTRKALSAALTFSAAATRRTARALSAGLSFAAALSTLATQTYQQVLTATLSFTGTIGKRTSRSLSGSLSPQGVVVRTTNRLITASLSFGGQVSRFTSRSLTAALVTSGSLSRRTARALTASVGFLGTMVGALIEADTKAFRAVGRAGAAIRATAGQVASTLRGRGKAGKL